MQIPFLLWMTLSGQFQCNLELQLLENANSTESKRLTFVTQVSPEFPESKTTGKLTTLTCFGKIYEDYRSEKSQFQTIINGDLIEGTFLDQNVQIGTHRYNLALHFNQFIKDPNDPKQIHFITKGKLLPIDQDEFFHQIAKGECIFIKDPEENS